MCSKSGSEFGRSLFSKAFWSICLCLSYPAALQHNKYISHFATLLKMNHKHTCPKACVLLVDCLFVCLFVFVFVYTIPSHSKLAKCSKLKQVLVAQLKHFDLSKPNEHKHYTPATAAAL